LGFLHVVLANVKNTKSRDLAEFCLEAIKN
jgi:hypothetical protein